MTSPRSSWPNKSRRPYLALSRGHIKAAANLDPRARASLSGRAHHYYCHSGRDERGADDDADAPARFEVARQYNRLTGGYIHAGRDITARCCCCRRILPGEYSPAALRSIALCCGWYGARGSQGARLKKCFRAPGKFIY